MKVEVPPRMRVWYEHIRYRENTRGMPISPRGGRTIAKLYVEGEDPKVDPPVAEGEANCSVNDNYSKKVGRDIALGRAVAQVRRAEEGSRRVGGG